MHLFSSCYQLLCDIKDLGGEDHATIRAAVLEQMADGHLSRVGTLPAAYIQSGTQDTSTRGHSLQHIYSQSVTYNHLISK